MQAVANNPSQFVLVNMWATWCSPCVEEFPELVEVHSKWSGIVDVLFVSVDFREQYDEALGFLNDMGWTNPSFFKMEKDQTFVSGIDDKWTGAVPATFIFATDETLLWSKQQQTSFAEVDSVITALIKQSR